MIPHLTTLTDRKLNFVLDENMSGGDGPAKTRIVDGNGHRRNKARERGLYLRTKVEDINSNSKSRTEAKHLRLSSFLPDEEPDSL